MKFQTNGMIAIYQEDSTVMIHPLKMDRLIQDMGLAKRRSTQLKREKIRTDELFYQIEQLHTEAVLQILSKDIAEEISTVL